MSTLTVSLTVKYPGFFTPSLSHHQITPIFLEATIINIIRIVNDDHHHRINSIFYDLEALTVTLSLIGFTAKFGLKPSSRGCIQRYDHDDHVEFPIW